MENLPVMGLWWLPDAEANKVHGTLSFSKDGTAALSLTRSFNDSAPHDAGTPNRYPAVLGDTRDGKEITLLDVYTTSRSGHSITHRRVIERGPESYWEMLCLAI